MREVFSSSPACGFGGFESTIGCSRQISAPACGTEHFVNPPQIPVLEGSHSQPHVFSANEVQMIKNPFLRNPRIIRVGKDPRSLSPTVKGDPPLPSPHRLHQSMSSPLLGKGTDLISSSPSCRARREGDTVWRSSWATRQCRGHC